MKYILEFVLANIISFILSMVTSYLIVDISNKLYFSSYNGIFSIINAFVIPSLGSLIGIMLFEKYCFKANLYALAIIFGFLMGELGVVLGILLAHPIGRLLFCAISNDTTIHFIIFYLIATFATLFCLSGYKLGMKIRKEKKNHY